MLTWAVLVGWLLGAWTLLAVGVARLLGRTVALRDRQVPVTAPDVELTDEQVRAFAQRCEAEQA